MHNDMMNSLHGFSVLTVQQTWPQGLDPRGAGMGSGLIFPRGGGSGGQFFVTQSGKTLFLALI